MKVAIWSTSLTLGLTCLVSAYEDPALVPGAPPVPVAVPVEVLPSAGEPQDVLIDVAAEVELAVEATEIKTGDPNNEENNTEVREVFVVAEPGSEGAKVEVRETKAFEPVRVQFRGGPGGQPQVVRARIMQGKQKSNAALVALRNQVERLEAHAREAREGNRKEDLEQHQQAIEGLREAIELLESTRKAQNPEVFFIQGDPAGAAVRRVEVRHPEGRGPGPDGQPQGGPPPVIGFGSGFGPGPQGHGPDGRGPDGRGQDGRGPDGHGPNWHEQQGRGPDGPRGGGDLHEMIRDLQHEVRSLRQEVRELRESLNSQPKLKAIRARMPDGMARMPGMTRGKMVMPHMQSMPRMGEMGKAMEWKTEDGHRMMIVIDGENVDVRKLMNDHQKQGKDRKKGSGKSRPKKEKDDEGDDEEEDDDDDDDDEGDDDDDEDEGDDDDEEDDKRAEAGSRSAFGFIQSFFTPAREVEIVEEIEVEMKPEFEVSDFEVVE